MTPRYQGRFTVPGTAVDAPLLSVPGERSRAAALLGALGGRATAAKVRGGTLLVADILRAQAGLPRGPWWRG